MATDTMPKQLSLNAGGATVDTSEIAGIGWAAGTKGLDGELKKGSDVELRLHCRVTAVKVKDVYDAHGNVSETIREHTLVVHEQLGVELLDAQAYRQRNEPASSNGTEPTE